MLINDEIFRHRLGHVSSPLSLRCSIPENKQKVQRGSCFSPVWSFPIICGRNIRSYLYLMKLLRKRQHKQKHSPTHTPLGQAGYHVVQISGIFRTPLEFGKEVISRPNLVPFHISFSLTCAKDHDAKSYYERDRGSWMAYRWTIDNTVVSQLVRHCTL